MVDTRFQQLVDELRSGSMDRRSFVVRAVALGASAGVGLGRLIVAPLSLVPTLDVASVPVTLLLGAGEKGRRYALPHSRIMIHQPLGGARGQATDIEIQAREIRHMKDVVTDILVSATGKNRDDIIRDIERDFYMGPVQAKEYGLIDEIFEHKKP